MSRMKMFAACTAALAGTLAGVLAFVATQAQAQQSANPEITVLVSTQDAQGVTQASFDLSFLQLMESHLLERTRVKANEYLVSIGKSNQRARLTSQATYVESGTKKLIVIRITDEHGITSVTVAGLVGAELKRVLCMKATLGAPPISYGPCGQKISEIFGVRL